jgi:hypothetical protein
MPLLSFYLSAYPVLLLQAAINNLISTNISLDIVYKPLQYDGYRLKIFENPQLGFVVCFIVFSAFIPLLQNMIFRMQNDKVSRMREAMMMMGLHTSSYFVSYVLFHLFVSSIVSLEVSVMSFFGFFRNSNPLLLFITMMLFAQNLVPFAAAVKYCINIVPFSKINEPQWRLETCASS